VPVRLVPDRSADPPADRRPGWRGLV